VKAFVPNYQVITPKNLDHALSILSSEPGKWTPLAGGTDLMVLFEAGTLPEGYYMNIWPLQELKGIEVDNSHVTMGALTTYSQVLDHPTIQENFPMLCQAALLTGARAIQNRGTLGGNIVNASPAADSPPALLCYDAEIFLVSKQGGRWVPYHQFHTGYKTTVMRRFELLSKIRLPRIAANVRQFYRKVGTRDAQAISKVCFAGLLRRSSTKKIEHVRLAFASMAATPVRCIETENYLCGKQLSAQDIAEACATLSRELVPISDIRSNKDYRKKVALNLLQDFLT